MSGAPVTCVVDRGLATLTLNRPDQLNALNLATFRVLDGHLARIEADPAVGCVVLRGAGRSFCAGHDLGDIAAGDEDGAASAFESRNPRPPCRSDRGGSRPLPDRRRAS